MRALRWLCGAHDVDLGRSRIMGILNVTPDSFSDGGLHDGTAAAIEWGLTLLDQGADIVDVGGESTRPGFTPLKVDEEAARVVPVIRALAEQGAVVSVDTRHADVARAALHAGANILNDVTGFADPKMRAVAASSDCGCVVMHSPSDHPVHGRAADGAEGAPGRIDRGSVERALLRSASVLEDEGVCRERICIDPGTGFGWSHDVDLDVLKHIGGLARHGYACMCAVSRKRLPGLLSGIPSARDRDDVSIGMALAGAGQGARVLRVHDVAGTRAALDGYEACTGSAPLRHALVALGSNLGDRLESLDFALGEMGALPLTRVLAVSGVYETEPAYLVEQPAFANAVALLETGLHPMALLGALLSIEDRAGRVREVRNGARSLDLDLLWMEAERHAGRRLRLPHPRIAERDFVLTPLCDMLGGEQGVARFCKMVGASALPREERLGKVVRRLAGPQGQMRGCRVE